MQYYKNTITSDVYGFEDDYINENTDLVLMTVAEVDLYINPPKTIAEIELEIEQYIQSYLDETAVSFGFRGALPMDRAVGYLNSKDLIFAGYATQLSEWRDRVWRYVEDEKAKVGITRTLPTKEDFLSEIQAEQTTLTPVKA